MKQATRICGCDKRHEAELKSRQLMKLPSRISTPAAIACALWIAAHSLQADVILHDSFITVPASSQNPNAGQYRSDNGLNNANNNFINGGSIIGFNSSNVWTGNSGLPRTVETGLASNSIITSGGSVEFRGANDTVNRMIYRQINGYTAPTDTYFSGILQTSLLDDNAVSLIAFTQSGGEVRGNNILNNTGDFYNGLAFGFLGDGDGGMNLVVRYRDASLNYVDFTLMTGIEVGVSYTVTGRIDWNAAPDSRDPFTIWVNPQSVTEPTAGGFNLTGYLGDPTTINSAYLLQKDFGTGIGEAVYMDELRLGSAWADLQPVPEPNAFVLASLASLGLFARFRCRRRES